THSHKHEVHAVRRLLTRAINFVQPADDLRDDLARSHAAFDAQLRGHAEAASDGATYLATDADGVAPLFGHKHSLGFAPVAEFEQVTPGPVGRSEHIDDLSLGDARNRIQLLAQIF